MPANEVLTLADCRAQLPATLLFTQAAFHDAAFKDALIMKKPLIQYSKPTSRKITVGEARELCQLRGVRIMWRADGIVSRVDSSLDLAEVLEG